MPRKEKYLKEVTEELSRAKESFNTLKKSHKKDSSEVKFAEKEIRRLTLICNITSSEIKGLKENYERGIKTGREMKKYHYKNMAKAERIWGNLVTILFNFVWLEDQWKTACNEVEKPEMFDKAFKKDRAVMIKWMRQKLCMPQKYGEKDKVPNSYTTDFILPCKIDRAENPHHNNDISPYEIRFDDYSMNAGIKNRTTSFDDKRFNQKANEALSYSPCPNNIRQIKGSYDKTGNFVYDPSSNLHMTALHQEDNISYDVKMDEIDFYNQNSRRIIETFA